MVYKSVPNHLMENARAVVITAIPIKNIPKSVFANKSTTLIIVFMMSPFNN